MRDRSEADPLKADPSWENLIDGLKEREIAPTCAQVIIYGTETNYPLSPGTIVRKALSADGNLPLDHDLNKILEKIESKFGENVARQIKNISDNMVHGKNLDSLNFNKENLEELRYGKINGISGKWKRMTSGGTWTIYTNRAESKVLKATNKTGKSWESAVLVCTHEKVAERIEELPDKYRLSPPKNHDIVITQVDGKRVAVAIMDYEKNYVNPGSTKDGLEQARKVLRRMFESGELPAHEFDYDSKGLKRKNMAYRDGEFIALDLCDKCVLDRKDFLRENNILEKVEKLGFTNDGGSFLGSLFGRFK